MLALVADRSATDRRGRAGSRRAPASRYPQMAILPYYHSDNMAADMTSAGMSVW